MKIFNTKLYILKEMTQEDLNNLALERNTLVKENKRQQTNWSELKKSLKSLYDFDTGVISQDYLECVQDTLDKMKELEGKNE